MCTAVDNCQANEHILWASFGILDKHIKILIVVKNTGID